MKCTSLYSSQLIMIAIRNVIIYSHFVPTTHFNSLIFLIRCCITCEYACQFYVMQ